MKLIRYLIDIELLKTENIKQDNGTFKKNFNLINNYKVQKNDLIDDVSASIYGADITKMLNISTPLGDLEEYLIPKVDNNNDNISLYFISINNTRYKIKSVTEDKITIERI